MNDQYQYGNKLSIGQGSIDYQGIVKQIMGSGGTTNQPLIYWDGFTSQTGVSVLNIDAKEKEIKDTIESYKRYLDQERLIENLHPATKQILRIVYEINKSNNINDLEKLDSYVRNTLFNKGLEEYLDDR